MVWELEFCKYPHFSRRTPICENSVFSPLLVRAVSATIHTLTVPSGWQDDLTQKVNTCHECNSYTGARGMGLRFMVFSFKVGLKFETIIS